MTRAVIGGGGQDVITVTFAYPITAAQFTALNFISNPSEAVGDTVAQVSANVVNVTLDATAAGDTLFSYLTTLGGFNFPQNIAY